MDPFEQAAAAMSAPASPQSLQQPNPQPAADPFVEAASRMVQAPSAVPSPAPVVDQRTGLQQAWDKAEDVSYEAVTGTFRGVAGLASNAGTIGAAGMERVDRTLGYDEGADYWKAQQPAYQEFQQKVENYYPHTDAAVQDQTSPEAFAGMIGHMAPDLVAAALTGGASLPVTSATNAAGESYRNFYTSAKQQGMNDEDANRIALIGASGSGTVNALLARLNPLASKGGFPGGMAGKIVGGIGANQAIGIAGSQVDPIIGAGLGLNKLSAEDLTQRAGESIVSSTVAGVVGGGVDILAHGGQPHADPFKEAAARMAGKRTEVPVPSAETLATLKTAPTPEAPAGRELLDSHQPKVRVTEGGTSRGVAVDFENPIDKALFAASYPRRGKVSAQAEAFLESQGYKAEDITRYADELRGHVEEAAQRHQGEEPLRVPSTQEAPAAEATPARESAPSEPQVQQALPDSETIRRTPQDEHLERVMPGATRVARGLENHQEYLDIHRELTGKDAVPYMGGRGRGFRSDGETFYSVERNRTPQQRREAIAHEATHDLQDRRPDLVAEIDKAIPDRTRNELLREYRESYKAQEGMALDPAMEAKEVQAMAVGRAFSRPGVARQVMQSNPSALLRGVDAVVTRLRGLTSKGRLTNQIIETLRKVRAEAPANSIATRRTPEADVSNFLPESHQRIRDEAEDYAQQHGIPYHPTTDYAPVNEVRAKRIATAYADLKHEPASPQVKASYDALKKETLGQWNYLKDQGVKFEAWDKPGQPYAGSADMMRDARDNKHLYFFQGGDMPADHPLAEKAPGTPYTYNDVFRAVHDYFGHAKEGVAFGPRGEENAWRQHSAMYSDAARPAMTTETRGQNSWVNYGPHGEHNRANPTDTRYADQKAGLLPPAFHGVQQTVGLRDLPADHPIKRQLAELEGENTKLRDLRDRAREAVAQAADGKPAFLPEYKPKNEENKEALETLRTHLRPEEWESLSTSDAKKGVELLKSLPPDSEYAAAAKAGQAMKGWYERSVKTLKATFGKDTRRFVALLAATSPRQSVVANLREATRVWAEWEKAGRPTDPEQIRTLLDTPRDTGEKDLFGAAVTEKTVKMSGRIPNAVRALSAPEGDLSGFKVNSFSKNLNGEYEHSTNDTWMATFGGVDQKEFANRGGYLGYTAKIRRVAKQLGWTPANVQETVWSLIKTLAEATPKGGSAVETLKGLTHEQLAATPAFDALLGDSDVREALRRAGLQPPAGRTESSGLTGRVVERITPDLRSIAERAERYVGNRGASEDPSLEFLPGSAAAHKFVEDDVAPTVEAAGEAVRRAWTGIKSLVGPQTRGPQAKLAANILRERGAELAQRYDRLNAAFEESRKHFDKVPAADSRQFIDDLEAGRPQANSAYQPVADAVRGLLDDRLHQVQALGTGKLANFVEDYFPHLWKDPTKASTVYAEAVAKAPLEGRKSFLKRRTLPTLADGLARGLEPVTENPVEAMMLRVREMDKYITATQAFKELQAKGLLTDIKARDKVPLGYAKINDNIATTYAAPSRRGAIQVQGYKVAPEPVANVINNYLSPGLRGNKAFGGLFRAYLGAGNVMNQVQLGMSAFHLLNTGIDSATSKMALSIKQIGSGQYREGIGSAAKSLTFAGPALENIRQGSQLMQEWYKPGSTTPELATLVDTLKAAGGRVKMDDFYRTGMTEKMVKAFRDGNYLGGALRLPFAGMEQMAKPIMEKIVPRMKLGVFMDMARFEINKLGPGASRDDIRQAAGRAWDSVDNRMGELVYDNLFWNKAVKDLAMASTRSVGWNLGTLRELGGGLLDFANAGRRIAVDRSLGNVELTHRMAYTIATPVMAGLLGGLVHVMLNGKAPETLKDYFFPRTGEKDKEGHDVRLALPSYMKDIIAYGKDPVATVSHKVHPMVSTILEMLKNEDFYGTKIRNEDDPFVKQMVDELKHAAGSFKPFGVTEVQRLAKQGQGAKSLLPLAGIVQARKDITNSAAELEAQKLTRDRMPRGTRTQEQADRSRLTRELADAIHSHEPDARQRIKEAYTAGKITDADVETIKNRQAGVGLLERSVKRLDLLDAMKVWEKADDGEKRRIGKLMFGKLRTAKALTREERVTIMAQLQSDWRRLKEAPAPTEGQE